MTLKVGAGGVVSLARAQYAPTLTAHDPNPPLPIDSPPPSTFGGEELHAAPTGRSWAVAFAVLPMFAIGTADELPVGGAPPTLVEESDAFRPVVWPVRMAPRLAHDDPTPTNAGLPAQNGLTLYLDFSDVGTLTLTGALIDQVDDQSGNNYDFTQTGDNRPTSEVDGVLGQAATFIVDGSTDDWMQSTATVANVTNASAWTIIARIRVASITSALASTYGDGVLFPYGSSGPGIHLRSDGAGDDRAYAINEDGGWPPDECYVAIDLDTELILVAKLEGGTLSIQIGNGTPATVSSGNVTATTETWRLGYAPGGGNWFDGAMSHVLAWDRALSEGEITEHVAWLATSSGFLADDAHRPAGAMRGEWARSTSSVDDDLPVYVAPMSAPADDAASVPPRWSVRHTVDLARDDEAPAGSLHGCLVEDHAALAAPIRVEWRHALAAPDDDAPIAAAPVALDDGARTAAAAWPDRWSVATFDDEVVGQLTVAEEHNAPSLSMRLLITLAAGWSTDDEPAGSLHGAPVEEHVGPGSAPPFPRLTWWDARTFVDDDVPAGSLRGCPVEEPGAQATPAWVPWCVPTVALAANDLAIAPAVMVEDGHAPPPPVWPPQRLREVRGEQEQEPAGSLHGCLPDDDRSPEITWRQAWNVAASADDAVVVTSSATPVSEEAATAALRWRMCSVPFVYAAEDEAPRVFAGDDDAMVVAPRWPVGWLAVLPVDDAASVSAALDDDSSRSVRAWPRSWSVAAPADDGCEVVATLADDDQGLLPPCAWPFVLWPAPITDDPLRTTIPGVPFVAVIEGRGMVAELEPEPMTAAIDGGDATVTIEGGGDTVTIEGRAMVVDLEGRT